MRRPRWRWLATVLLLVPTLAGCGSESSGTTPTTPDLPLVRVVTGTGHGGDEYRFEAPDRITAGPTQLALSNRGQEPHHAQVFRLDDDATVPDLEAALAKGSPKAALDVGTFMGGTGLVTPGQDSRADAVLDLGAGDYALICFVPDADGVPHVAHGMLHPFEVGRASDESSPPVPDAEVDLVDYGFGGPRTLLGDATLSITNASQSEAHEMVVAELDPGRHVDDITSALDQHEPLPAVGLGGMQAILPGTTETLRLDLDPGRYGLFCAVTSPNGTPHYRAGMVREITVR
jgi:hypothetical protein